ncbi:hypothetical protein HK100_003120 [Physocladia obscura]|uniref:BHLH domain-containing protein n=1 Tax=Physocladia obscura TaxID=109957 RepID=A0AAD5XL95_9FUNG|nr:hypothetical protein HK100_003120 [Physocladia obscura]
MDSFSQIEEGELKTVLTQQDVDFLNAFSESLHGSCDFPPPKQNQSQLQIQAPMIPSSKKYMSEVRSLSTTESSDLLQGIADPFWLTSNSQTLNTNSDRSWDFLDFQQTSVVAQSMEQVETYGTPQITSIVNPFQSPFLQPAFNDINNLQPLTTSTMPQFDSINMQQQFSSFSNTRVTPSQLMNIPRTSSEPNLRQSFNNHDHMNTRQFAQVSFLKQAAMPQQKYLRGRNSPSNFMVAPTSFDNSTAPSLVATPTSITSNSTIESTTSTVFGPLPHSSLHFQTPQQFPSESHQIFSPFSRPYQQNQQQYQQYQRQHVLGDQISIVNTSEQIKPQMRPSLSFSPMLVASSTSSSNIITSMTDSSKQDLLPAAMVSSFSPQFGVPLAQQTIALNYRQLQMVPARHLIKFHRFKGGVTGGFPVARGVSMKRNSAENVERRREYRKEAEQKRRVQLKDGFDSIKELVCDTSKNISKERILEIAVEHIEMLTKAEMDKQTAIEEMGVQILALKLQLGINQ